MHNGGDAGVLEAAREIKGSELGRLGPARHRDLAIARIKTDGDAARIGAGRLHYQGRIAHRRGPDDHAANALGEPGIDGGAVANAAAELDRNLHRIENVLDRRRVDRPTGKRAVEIDNVQIAKSLL